MKIGSLCTGYGGLDMAVEAYFNAEMVWCAENNKYASKLIEQRFNKHNYGDIKSIKWDELEPIDILTAGYPCQPFSTAGQRKGIDDERHIWPYIKEAISILRPKIIVLENVRGHLTLGFDQVLADLTEIGYDAKWQIVRASDVGAPHQRARLFIIANAQSGRPRCKSCRVSQSNTWPSCNCQSIAYPISQGLQRSGWQTTGSGSKIISNSDDQQLSSNRKMSRLGRRFNTRSEMHLQDIPHTLVNGKLNAVFVEYMMGLPIGWVTDLDLSRAQQLKMLGNGVVPQQAYHALQILCDTPSDLRLC